MSKAQHTSKVSESAPNRSLITRIKSLFGIGHGVQEIDQRANEADEGKIVGAATHDKQKIWKKQIGGILPHGPSDAVLPVKHGGDREANQTPSNLG